MREPQRIDSHHHIVPPAYRQWLADKGVTAGGREIPEWSADDALRMMDVNSVRTAIMSVSTPGVEPGELHEARAMARRVNEYAAEVCSDHPDRFGFFATLTLPDVDGALAEVEHAYEALGADGVILLANSRGTYLGDASFDPLMEELDRRGAVILIHPSHLPADPVPGIPPFTADFLLDTTRAAINFAKSGSLDRYPNLRVILSHAGGFVPFAASRIALMSSPLDEEADGIRLLRKYYFDTALSGSPFALPSLLALADPDHIVYGSDWPYATDARAAHFTGMLDEFLQLDHDAINRGNAEALFPRFAR